jgi:hypothetical protein
MAKAKKKVPQDAPASNDKEKQKVIREIEKIIKEIDRLEAENGGPIKFHREIH